MMNTNQPHIRFDSVSQTESGDIARNFLAQVFSWMTIGLLLTAFVAWYSASSGMYQQLVGSGGLMSWVIILAPFAFIIAMNVGLQKYSATTLTMLFLAFSATMGISLGSVFLMYPIGSITQVFVITAGTFESWLSLVTQRAWILVNLVPCYLWL